MSLRTRERRSSFELIAEGMRRGSSRVADVERDFRPDPTLTNEERAALQVAVESVRGDVSPAKLIGPQISKGPGWSGGARVPDGRIFFAPSSAKSVLCFDPATGEASFIGKISGRGKYVAAVLGADGAVYFVPCHARRVMRLDPGTMENIGRRAKVRRSWRMRRRGARTRRVVYLHYFFFTSILGN